MPNDIRLSHVEFKSHLQNLLDEYTTTPQIKLKEYINQLQTILNNTRTGTELWEELQEITQTIPSSSFFFKLKKSLAQFPKEQLMRCDIELLKRYNNLHAVNYQKLLLEHQTLQINFTNLQRSIDKFSLDDVNTWQKLEIDNQQLKNNNSVLQKENDLFSAKINELQNVNKKQVSAINELEDSYEHFQQSISEKFKIIEQKQLQQREEITRLHDTLQNRDTTIKELQQQLATFRPNLSRNSASHFKSNTQNYINNPRMESNSTKEQF